jgi:hypothetical protein
MNLKCGLKMMSKSLLMMSTNAKNDEQILT